MNEFKISVLLLVCLSILTICQVQANNLNNEVPYDPAFQITIGFFDYDNDEDLDLILKGQSGDTSKLWVLENQSTPWSFEFVEVDISTWDLLTIQDLKEKKDWLIAAPLTEGEVDILIVDLTTPTQRFSGEDSTFFFEETFKNFAEDLCKNPQIGKAEDLLEITENGEPVNDTFFVKNNESEAINSIRGKNSGTVNAHYVTVNSISNAQSRTSSQTPNPERSLTIGSDPCDFVPQFPLSVLVTIKDSNSGKFVPVYDIKIEGQSPMSLSTSTGDTLYTIFLTPPDDIDVEIIAEEGDQVLPNIPSQEYTAPTTVYKNYTLN